MLPRSILTDFSFLRPKLKMTQAESLAYLAKHHARLAAEQNETELDEPRLNLLLRRFGVKPEQISSRGLESHEMSGHSRSLLERTRFFEARANEVLKTFYENTVEAPSHLIHVTCTGYVSPSAAQHLVNFKNWNAQTRVTHAYHMGCYASMPAIRIAEGLLNNPGGRVDLVHTEMCSLHLNPSLHTPEQLVVQSLFADGYIRYSLVPETKANPRGLRVLTLEERIVKDSEPDMTWITADTGMHMTLSRDVPSKIGSEIRDFVSTLAKSSGIELGVLLKSAIFAVHPGGPKIIDSVREKLELSDWQVQDSKTILLEYGNMSSATLPHVWERILRSNSKNQPIVSLAFGPGLTLFGAVFETV
jgi:predicted naringenin-chalcone synthase